MSNDMNLFVTESNVDIYLSKAYQSLDDEERNTLLRLVIDEEDRMGSRREHLENGQRRLEDCELRIRRQREIVSDLAASGQDASQAASILGTYERILGLLQQHQRMLRQRFKQAGL